MVPGLGAMLPGRSLSGALPDLGNVTGGTAAGSDGSESLACDFGSVGSIALGEAGGKQLSNDAPLATGARSRALRESNLRLLPARLSRPRGSGFGDIFLDMIALQVSVPWSEFDAREVEN